MTSVYYYFSMLIVLFNPFLFLNIKLLKICPQSKVTFVGLKLVNYILVQA